MITTATYSVNGTEIQFRKSLRSQMIFLKFQGEIAPDGTAWDYDERRRFAWIAGHVQTVSGLDWTPPQPSDSAKKLEASYQAFIEALPDLNALNAIEDVINALYAPLADEVERPNETLTAEQQADPN